MKFEIYREPAGLFGLGATTHQWRWRLRAVNGEPIASGESYVNKGDCLYAVNLVRGAGPFTPVVDLS